MTVTTATRSAFPPQVDDLMPRALELTATLGKLPSQNRIKTELKVGVDKAKEVRRRLEAPAETPAAPPALLPAPAPVQLPNIPPDPDPPAPAADPVDSDPPAASELTPPPPPPVAATATVVPPPEGVSAGTDRVVRRPIVWPVLILCLPAFVAIWGGWVEMGRLTGFGMVTLLPGISDFQINTAITLPIGMETLAAYAVYVWLSGTVTGPALRFAKWSALVSLTLGALGQIAYHLMASWGWESAPWPITAAVACIPVAVLGMGAALAHLMHRSPR